MPTSNLMAATTAAPQVLVAQQLANSETTQYTCPANTSVKLASVSLCNTSVNAVSVSLSVVKSGGTAGASNRVVSGYAIAAGDSSVIAELVGVFLGPGDFVSAIAATGSAVALAISGVVFS
jgi:hypothetical protein